MTSTTRTTRRSPAPIARAAICVGAIVARSRRRRARAVKIGQMDGKNRTDG